MAAGFPLKINGIKILTSEALYQTCRFPHLPDVQKKIINEKSPMTAKMVCKPFRDNSRSDWEKIRVEVMYWCLRVKLAQNFITFGRILESTYNKPIVEDSRKDRFWGAVKDKNDENTLTGVNALGRYLMKLRQEYYSEKRYDLLYVEPLNIPDFNLFDQPIQIIDERVNFINYLNNLWKLPKTQYDWENDFKNLVNKNEISVVAESSNSSVDIINEKESKSKKKTRTPKKIKNVNAISLFNT